MDFAAFQQATRDTARTTPGDPESDIFVFLLGLAGEAGSVASVYKKMKRDQESYESWRVHMREELGDTLWYLATLADRLDFSLDDIAQANLEKTRSRWLKTNAPQLDSRFPPGEQLPRHGSYKFVQSQRASDGQLEVRIFFEGRQVGDELTDNAHNDDGYRFHDVFHLAYAALLGWSPLTRSLLQRKRKSRPDIDEAQDGGRAIVLEEAVAAIAFAYGVQHHNLDGVTRLDESLLDVIASTVSLLEVGVRSAADWEDAILQGFTMFRELLTHGGGTVEFDADARRLHFVAPPQPASQPTSQP